MVEGGEHLAHRLSPNKSMPKNTAVSGSSAPRIAVGVEPILCIARVVHTSDIAVGRRPSEIAQPHSSGEDGTFSDGCMNLSAMKIEVPKRIT